MTEASDSPYRFMSWRKFAACLSIALLVLSVGSLIFNGLKLGLDFTGGTLVEVKYEQEPVLNDVRNVLSAAGYEDAIVQNFGSSKDVLVRLPQSFSSGIGEKVLESLEEGATGGVELLRSEFVGPNVGEELRDQGGLGMLIALIFVMIYLAFRFQYKFSLGAVAALIHDVVLVLGLFSILRIDFDLTVLAALLAVIGYSLNDTIVVSDRIRENFRKIRRDDSEYIIDVALTQTLGRTLITSITTLFVLLALLFIGGELIRGFAIALTAGVVVGTYSSIYVASNMLLALGITREDLIPPPEPEDDGEELVDEMP